MYCFKKWYELCLLFCLKIKFNNDDEKIEISTCDFSHKLDYFLFNKFLFYKILFVSALFEKRV